MAEPLKLARAAIAEGMDRILRELLVQEPKLAKKAQLVVDCARCFNQKALDLLLDHGADIDSMNRGYGVLHAAIQEEAHGANTLDESKRLPFIRHVLDHGASTDLRGGWPAMRPIELAAVSRQRDVIDLLIQRGVEIDEFAAATLGDGKRVKRALAKDAEFAKTRDAGGLTALHHVAASRLHDDKKTAKALLAIAGELLDADADIAARAKSWLHEIDPIYLAISAHHFALAKLLLERGADASSGLVTAMWNTGDDFVRFGELCFECGADPNAVRYEKKPLLNDMVRWGRFQQALWLLDRGSDPNLTDERGWTAVHQAASRRNKRVLDALIAKGGRVDAKAKDGTRPIDLFRG